MPFVFDLDGAIPAVAVYEVTAGNESDRTPILTPTVDQSTFDRVKFHSNFAYPQIVDVQTYTLNLGLKATNNGFRNSVVDDDIILGAHGQPGQPWVIATTTIQGQEIAFAGSICVGLCVNTGYTPDREVGGLGRWVTIGANATNIIAHDYCVVPDFNPIGFNYRHIAQTLTITCYITNRILDT